MSNIVGDFSISLPQNWNSQVPRHRLGTDDEKMEFVLGLAAWNIAQQTGGPFAAAVFCRNTDELISMGVNRVVPSQCSLAHAEAVALSLAQKTLQTHDLFSGGSRDYELFASGQPCVQCFGMVWWSGITRLAIAARARDIEELTGFHEGPLPDDWQQRLAERHPLPSVEVVQDIRRDEARTLLTSYAKTGGKNYSPGLDDTSQPSP